jgi:hypothetical protein
LNQGVPNDSIAANLNVTELLTSFGEILYSLDVEFSFRADDSLVKREVGSPKVQL